MIAIHTAYMLGAIFWGLRTHLFSFQSEDARRSRFKAKRPLRSESASSATSVRSSCWIARSRSFIIDSDATLTTEMKRLQPPDEDSARPLDCEGHWSAPGNEKHRGTEVVGRGRRSARSDQAVETVVRARTPIYDRHDLLAFT